MPFLRSLFIALSRNRVMRRFSEHSAVGARLSSRFVAGMQIEDALRVAAALNAQGIAVTLDSLGESVTTAAEARQAAEIYHQLLDAIEARQLNANISVKLTQMGLELDPRLAEEIAGELAAHAARIGSFLRIDMEDSSLTDVTLEIVRRLHARPELAGAIGIVIQAYLYRSSADIEQLMQERIRVRLCKGAYKEPAAVAFPLKSDVDKNYAMLAQTLLTSGLFHGIATHDERMIAAIRAYTRDKGIAAASFEFQMLYGVRRDLQRELVQEGFGMRVYVPFGQEWYPYFMRRLAERPANVLFIARNFFRK
jgi:proline dehydrogenase